MMINYNVMSLQYNVMLVSKVVQLQISIEAECCGIQGTWVGL